MVLDSMENENINTYIIKPSERCVMAGTQIIVMWKHVLRDLQMIQIKYCGWAKEGGINSA